MLIAHLMHCRAKPRLAVLVAIAAGIAAGAGCRPLDDRARTSATSSPPVAATVARGAHVYATYCADCHGPDGSGDGPFATALGLTPADLRAPAVASVSDAALLDRLARGTPLDVAPFEAGDAESRAVDALAEYLPRLPHADWNVLRAGRVVYEEACAPCHGVYGRADTAIAHWVGGPDLIVAREHHSDAALARIAEAGFGVMPSLQGAFDRAELRSLAAYVRHLSDGYAVYDTRCAACHGDDGKGRDSRDLISPGIAAPPLGGGPYARKQLRSMLRRERGLMPHFAEIDERRLRDVVAYLRAGPFSVGPHSGNPHSEPSE